MNAITTERKATLFKHLMMIECQLSPENLHMDGEASPAQVKGTLAKLVPQKESIIKELGYEPTFQELYGK